MHTKPILYAEDDENDVFFMRRALKAAQMINPLQIVHDGQEAMDYLLGAEQFSDRTKYPRPYLILLDLNLPVKSGFDVLKAIRSSSDYQTIPVLILSSSPHDRDVHRAYSLGANAYLIKPSSAEKLVDTMRLVSSFWLQENKPPPDRHQLARSELVHF